MTNEQIIEGNKALAEFNEWERVYPGKAPKDNRGLAQFKNKDGRFYSRPIHDGVGENATIPFNSDWNYLMPVIEKIESFGYCFFIQNESSWIKPGWASLKPKEIDILADSKIEAAFKASVEFVNWWKIQAETDQNLKNQASP